MAFLRAGKGIYKHLGNVLHSAINGADGLHGGSGVANARHLAVTWSIPDNYGGMTNALFHRSRALVREAGFEVDVLTFDWRPSHGPLRILLEERGALIDGVNLLNIWEWLAGLSDQQIRDLHGNNPDVGFNPLDEASVCEVGETSRRRRYSADGSTLLQQDYYRADGSLLVSDRADIGVKGTRGKRRLFLCDHSGRPVRALDGTAALYHLWIDLLAADRQTFVIVDSKYTANFMAKYRRAHVSTIYMIHGSHLGEGGRNPYGRLIPGRRKAFRQLEDFDGVVLLTDRQRLDTAVRFGDFGNLYVIPNSRQIPRSNSKSIEREENRAVVVAGLREGKQIDHAIRAVDACNTQAGRDLQLHIFGHGPEAEQLADLISHRSLENNIHLEGFTHDVPGEFEKSSFSMLTSTSEGFGLVILESMSHGCIPICYDMNYGPSQMIQDGISGYLVPPDDEGALLAAIERFQDLAPRRKAGMRTAAVARAWEFSDEAVVPLWLSTFESIARRKAESGWSGRLSAQKGKAIIADGQTTITCDVNFSTPPVVVGVPLQPITVALRERQGQGLYRANARDVTRISDEAFRISADFPAHILNDGWESEYRVFVEMSGTSGLQSAPIAFGHANGKAAT